LSLPARITTFPVVLRPFGPADAPRVQELCGDRALAQMTALVPHPYPPGAAEAWIGTHADERAAGAAYNYAITRQEDGLVVGAIVIGARAATTDSLGYWVGRPYWGNGYATAAARALVALAFSHLDFDVVSAAHLAANPASGRVLEKCGMTLVRRETRPHRGSAGEEFLVWAVTRDAWEAASRSGS
jgi:ribosomal-protein-alanine N-acetyltransferase